jgi:hypothetical protein
MKSLIIVIILCFVININAQSKMDSLLLTETEWVNKDLDYLRFFKDSVVYNLSEAKHQLIFDIENRKLSFKVRYRVGGSGLRTEEFKFKIKELKKDKLVIEPILEKKNRSYSKLDYSLLSKEKQYIFYNRGHLLSSINFKKITFHTSTCFGTCPSMSIQINIDGTVYFQGRMYTNDYKGNFDGSISKNDIYQLKKILNRSQLADIDKNWVQRSKYNDTPRYNYIIELFDGETIEINTNDQHPVLDKLSKYFMNIPEIANLVKAKERHKFEKSRIDHYKVSQN